MNPNLSPKKIVRKVSCYIFFLLIAGSTVAIAQAVGREDPFLWLEAVEGEKALQWVKEQNEITLNYLTNKEGYQEKYDFRYKTLISEDNLMIPQIRDDYVYNFWQDDKYPRGVWRRKSFKDYLEEKGNWDLLLDIGKLSEKEGTNWVLNDVVFAAPGEKRCILYLSDGGSDAVYIREFDIEEKRFIEQGYTTGEAKSSLEWIDIDNVYIATDFGEGSLTTSGYPRIVKRWERGTPIEDAEVVFEASENDMGAYPLVWHFKHKRYEFIYHAIDFYHFKLYLVNDSGLFPISLPDDFRFEVYGDQLIVQPMTEWEYGKHVIKTNQLVCLDFKDILDKNFRYSLIFEAPERGSIEEFFATESHLVVNTLNNISSELLKFTYQDQLWKREVVDMPGKGSISIVSTSETRPYYFYTYESFIQPTTLYCDLNNNLPPFKVDSYPAYFDSSDLVVDQFEAASKDGTKIPYFIVHKKDLILDGSNATILYGYGGFQVSEKPYYSPALGKFWLEEGGVYVMANIRGGGEFGPAWHADAILENKQRSFDDFIAIAEDLISRKITSEKKIGIVGGSNGGLLVGAVMVQRPELFRAVVSLVPLLDMKRYSKLLAGHSWIPEYGDPDDPEQWEYIRKYSPYQNVKEGVRYPATLFLTSTRDDRVHPGHARKMTALLESLGNEVYLFENTEGGHNTIATPEQQARLTALYYTFFTVQLMNN